MNIIDTVDINVIIKTMGNKFEKIKPPESSKEKEQTQEQEYEAGLKEYLTDFRDMANDAQEELNQLLSKPLEERDNTKIKALKQKLQELDDEIRKMEGDLEWINESGEEFKIIKRRKVKKSNA